VTKSSAPDSNASASATTQGEQEIPVVRNADNDEPIRLSKFSGGYEPDPTTPHKIESLDWPAPPYPAAVPELRARSRSTSNRHAASTVQSVNGDYSDDDSDEDELTANGGGAALTRLSTTVNNNRSSSSTCPCQTHRQTTQAQ
jgi:hypothetical protein